MLVVRFSTLLLLPFSLCMAVTPSPAQQPPQGQLLFLGIAYDEAPAPGTSVDNFNYAPDNFTRLFRSQSKTLFSEIKFSTLKGSPATKSAVFGQLYRLQKIAKANDRVVIYWGTHGSTNKKGWGANLPGDQVVYGSGSSRYFQRCPVQPSS